MVDIDSADLVRAIKQHLNSEYAISDLELTRRVRCANRAWDGWICALQPKLQDSDCLPAAGLLRVQEVEITRTDFEFSELWALWHVFTSQYHGTGTRVLLILQD